MEKIVKILMARDELSRSEAVDLVESFMVIMNEMIGRKEGLTEIEELFMDEIGLEPDYMEEILFNL